MVAEVARDGRTDGRGGETRALVTLFEAIGFSEVD